MPPPGNVVAANYAQARNIQQAVAANRNAQNRSLLIEQTMATARQQQQQQKIQQLQQRLLTQAPTSPRTRQDQAQPPPLIPVNGSSMNNARFSSPPANPTTPTGADIIDLSPAPR